MKSKLATARWDEVRWNLKQGKLAIKLAESQPVRPSPWMLVYVRDVEALLTALGESTEVRSEGIPEEGADVRPG